MTKTEIANIALAKFREGRITTIESTTDPVAVVMNDQYDHALELLLEEHRWNFAAKRVALTKLSTAPPFGWDNQYALPADLIRLKDVNGEDVEASSRLFELEANNLLTNDDTVTITYVAKITDTNLYSPSFVEALSFKLASITCGRLTGDTELAIALDKQYNYALSKAVHNDTKANGSREHNLMQRMLNSSAILGGNNLGSGTSYPRTGGTSGTVAAHQHELTDLLQTSATAGQTIIWNDTDKIWEAGDAASGGDVSTDAIFDAAGDLVVGTGADTAAKLPIGAVNEVLKSNGTTAVWGVVAGSGDVVGDASSTDNAIARFNGTGGKTLQNSVVTINDTTGNITMPALSTVDGRDLSVDGTRLDSQVITDVINRLSWNATDLTFDIDTTDTDVVIQIGQELLVKAVNKTGFTLSNGAVVKIDGAQGSRPTISLAKADSLANINGVIGIITADILDNAEGFVTVHGLVRGLNTSAFTAGDEVFLSSTVDGGITNVEPALSVPVGTVTFSNAGAGSIFASVDNQKHLLEFAGDPTLNGNFSAASWKTALNLAGSNTGDEVAATLTVSGVAEVATAAEINAKAADSERIVTPNYLGQSKYSMDDETATLTNKTISGLANGITNVSLTTSIIGNLPIANLNSGSLATPLTFWRGDGTWATPAGGSASQLSDLSDVNTSTPTSGFALIADGVDFESRAIAAADVSDFDTEVDNNAAVALNTAKATNVSTDLSYTAAPTIGTVTSSDGTDATLTLATGTNAGLLAPADFTKLGLTTNTNSGDQTITLTGDVTGTGTGSFATTIATASVDIAMLSATGSPSASNYLQGDGTWATPSGTANTDMGLAVSDEATALTGSTTVALGTFHAQKAGTWSEILIGVTTAPTGSTLTCDVHKNGTTIFSTKPTIDATEKTSVTAATAAVISTTTYAKGDLIELFCDSVGTTIAGTGLKFYFNQT
tara:strand:+ start:1141 stop:3990 length:2850 start_codon:yes stop_codon:yes gene_type:complete